MWNAHSKTELGFNFFFSHHWQVSQIILDLMNPFQKNFILSLSLLPSPAGQEYRLKTLSCGGYRKELRCTWPRRSPQDISWVSQTHSRALKRRPKESSWWVMAIHRGSYLCPHHPRPQVASFSLEASHQESWLPDHSCHCLLGTLVKTFNPGTLISSVISYRS